MDIIRFSNTEIERLVTAFLAEVGENWISERKKVPAGVELHQLAQWLIQAKRELHAGELGIKTSQTMLRVAWLAHSIELLRNSNVIGVEERVKRLLTGDEGLFFSTVHEFRTASTYVHWGHEVSFIQEGPERTPDILLDNKIEVECKHKSRTTKKDRRRQVLYELLRRRIRKAVYSKGQAIREEGLEISVLFHGEPSRNVVDEIIERARSFWKDNSNVLEMGWNSKREYSIRFVHKEITGRSKAELVIRGLGAHYDVVDVQVETRDLTADLVENRRITLFAIKCTTEEDRIKSFRRSLGDAASQLSGERPGLIQFDLTALGNRLVADDVEKLRRVVDEVIRNRSSVSAICVTREHFHRDDTGWIMSMSLEAIRNPFSRFPIKWNDIGDASGTQGVWRV